MTTQSQAAKPPVTRFDAVIVGAGMVGAALAGLLAEAGMQVALVEAKASPLRLDDVAGEIPAPRVSALTPVSQRLLTHLGVWPAMAAAHSGAKTRRKWTAQLPTPRAMSPRTSWLPALPTVAKYRFRTRSVWLNPPRSRWKLSAPARFPPIV